MSKYPNVKNAHIVPRTYLANFARDGKIGVHVDRSPEALIQSVENVGTRRRYYRRHRPDGTPIDDMEWSLQMGETAAGPVLRKFAEEWPLQLEQKAVLAELFAYQLLRGPRWEAEQSQATEAILDELRDAKGTASTRLPRDVRSSEPTRTGSPTCSGRPQQSRPSSHRCTGRSWSSGRGASLRATIRSSYGPLRVVRALHSQHRCAVE